MWDRIRDLPLFVILMGIGALAMLVPAGYGLALQDYMAMRVFFYGTVLFSMLTLVLALATANYDPPSVARSQLLTLFAAFAILPVMFAVPFYEASSETRFLNAWFEMVSSFTTTGATLYDNPGTLSPSLHLWRATVGWLGGLLIWVTAVAIFAPMNLGGFEVRAHGGVGPEARASFVQIGQGPDPSERLLRYALQLTPIYIALTLTLWLGLVIVGEFPYVALCHAMAVMSTSGISPLNGVYFAASGFWGELLIFAFFAFAISRLTFSRGIGPDGGGRLTRDPEIGMALALVAVTTSLLVARHFVGSVDEGTQDTIGELFAALWGSIFTVTAFLTTTGFESHFWDGAAQWSGLDTPGLFLVGLAMIGGGVGTTAGGVKLLRVYALYRHSEREMERLIHPNSIGGGGKDARRIRRQGAYISWIFFMLFALSIAAVMLLLSMTGVEFESALVFTVAALSTTGPLAAVAAEQPLSYTTLTEMGKLVLCAAMVLGRLETLAIIALFNPEIWRK